MGPSLEGLYTIYGGDAEFMKQQQEQLPHTKQLEPIDTDIGTPPASVNLEISTTPKASTEGFNTTFYYLFLG